VLVVTVVTVAVVVAVFPGVLVAAARAVRVRAAVVVLMRRRGAARRAGVCLGTVAVLMTGVVAVTVFAAHRALLVFPGRCRAMPVAEYVLMYARDNVAGADGGQQLPSGAQIEAAVTALRMLADGTRLRLLWLLRDGEHDVSELTEAVGAARPAVSQHLAKLLLAGLVSSRREGRRVLYRARGGHVRRLVTEALHAADHLVSGLAEHD
jgi:DNA-binding transcriptional ArsR family regulator